MFLQYPFCNNNRSENIRTICYDNFIDLDNGCKCRIRCELRENDSNFESIVWNYFESFVNDGEFTFETILGEKCMKCLVESGKIAEILYRQFANEYRMLLLLNLPQEYLFFLTGDINEDEGLNVIELKFSDKFIEEICIDEWVTCDERFAYYPAYQTLEICNDPLSIKIRDRM